MRPSMRLAYFLLLLVGAALAQDQQQPTTTSFPGILAKGASQAKVFSQRQTSSSRLAWGLDPRCMAIYLNAPSWAHYDIKLTVESLSAQAMDPQCLKDAVRWRAVVVGADDLPRPLATAVGWEMPLRSTSYTESALYEDIPENDDYTAGPPATTAADRQAVLQGASDCLKQAAAAELLQVPATLNAAIGDVLAQPPPDLRACLAAIQLPGGARPPPPPPPPRPPKKGGVRRKVARARKSAGLAPFLRYPEHPADKNPNGNMKNPISASKVDYMTYEVQPEQCEDAFNEEGFHTNTMDQPTQSYDSCYYTQTIVYVYYDGSCDNGNTNLLAANVNVTVDALYTNYDGCDTGVLKLGKALQIIVWVTSVPVALFLFFLVYPTVGRILYRTWMTWFYLPCLTASRADTKRKHKLRMEMDAPLRWGWLLRFSARPWVASITNFRKRLIYSCLFIHNPNGRNRFLMVVVVATVATSVTVMVWRPQTQLVLNSNPSKITLQLDDVTGPYSKLSRYFQISAVSLYLGCLAYLVSLSNTNTPQKDDVLYDGAVGRPWSPWSVQRAIALTATGVLTFLLLLQAINITVFLPIITDSPSYVWIVVIQYINITLMVIMQINDIIMVQRQVRLRERPGSLPPRHCFMQYYLEKVFVAWERLVSAPKVQTLRNAQSVGPLAAASVFSGMDPRGGSSATAEKQPQPYKPPKLDLESQRVVQVLPGGAVTVGKQESLLPLGRRRSDGSRDGKLGAGTGGDGKGGESKDGQGKGGVEEKDVTCMTKLQRWWRGDPKDVKEVKRKNKLLHWWRGDRDDAYDEGLSKEEIAKRKREDEEEVEINVFRQMQMIFMDALGEDSLTVTWNGVTFTSPTFRYPTWFLASVLVALYMLIFHFCKSLGFGNRLAYCFVSWSECDVAFIRNFATTFSFEQLGVLRSAAHQVGDQLRGLQDVQVLINALLDSRSIDTSLDQMISLSGDIEAFATPGNSSRAVWLAEYGKQLATVTTLGFSLGLVLGVFTLVKALHSFKAISKKHRLLVLTRRILQTQEGGPGQVMPLLSMAPSMQAEGALQALNTVMGSPLRRRHTRATRRNSSTMMGSMRYGSGALSPHISPTTGASVATQAPSGRGWRQPGLLPLPGSGGDGNRVEGPRSKTTVMPTGSAIPEDEPWANVTVTGPGSNLSNTGPASYMPSHTGSPERNASGLPGTGPTASDSFASKKTGVNSPPEGMPPPPLGDTAPDYSDSDSDENDDDLKPLKEPEVFGVTTIAAFRALNARLPTAVFFLGVLLSCTVVQLYSLGIILSAALAYLLHPYFWTNVVGVYWPYVLVAIFVIILNKGLVLGLIGGQYVSDGRQILRPAGWVAFLIVTSITNLVLGLPIAITRLVWLVLTSILTVGLLDRTILAVGHGLDMPHNSFLATVYLQDGVGKADSRSFRPGSHWRAIKRWRGAIRTVVRLGGRGFARLVARNEVKALKAAQREANKAAQSAAEEEAPAGKVEMQQAAAAGGNKQQQQQWVQGPGPAAAHDMEAGGMPAAAAVRPVAPGVPPAGLGDKANP